MVRSVVFILFSYTVLDRATLICRKNITIGRSLYLLYLFIIDASLENLLQGHLGSIVQTTTPSVRSIETPSRICSAAKRSIDNIILTGTTRNAEETDGCDVQKQNLTEGAASISDYCAQESPALIGSQVEDITHKCTDLKKRLQRQLPSLADFGEAASCSGVEYEPTKKRRLIKSTVPSPSSRPFTLKLSSFSLHEPHALYLDESPIALRFSDVNAAGESCSSFGSDFTKDTPPRLFGNLTSIPSKKDHDVHSRLCPARSKNVSETPMYATDLSSSPDCNSPSSFLQQTAITQLTYDHREFLGSKSSFVQKPSIGPEWCRNLKADRPSINRRGIKTYKQVCS